MKRLTSILLALVMVISLVGCGNSADTEETETSSEAVETAEEGTPEEFFGCPKDERLKEFLSKIL